MAYLQSQQQHSCSAAQRMQACWVCRRSHIKSQRSTGSTHCLRAGYTITGLEVCQILGCQILAAFRGLAGFWPHSAGHRLLVATECHLLQSAGKEVPLRELEHQSSPGQPVGWKSHAVLGTQPCRQQNVTCHVFTSCLHTQSPPNLTPVRLWQHCWP